MTTKILSTKQERILKFIAEFLEDNGYPPSIRDIQNGCNMSSTSVVDYNLHILEKKGHIQRSREISRGIELLHSGKSASSTLQVPVLGFIAAGEPIPVPGSETWHPEAPLETIEISPAMASNHTDIYGLKVKGMSMIDALIDDGDIVLVTPTQHVLNGEMVVAWLKLEKEVTLKRFYLEETKIRLQPANKQMKPIYVEPSNLEVQGKVVGVVRNLK